MLSQLAATVSRSFSLTLRLLPRPVRAPVTLAYLLARATDTLADTAAAPVPLRRQSLRHLRHLVLDPASDPDASATLAQPFLPHQTHQGERHLLTQLPALLRHLAALPPDDQTAIRHVLDQITQGQLLDLDTFSPDDTETAPPAVRALPTRAHLHTYTHLVAGCVGEFWTGRVLAHCPRALRPPPDGMDTLLADAIRFGQGLQLVNILRDLPADLLQGRCYLPADQLAETGLTPAQFAADPAPHLPRLLAPWLALARAHLRHGWRYSRANRALRLRLACALPLALAERTLDLVAAADWETYRRRVKVPRPQMRRLIWTLLLHLAHRPGGYQPD